MFLETLQYTHSIIINSTALKDSTILKRHSNHMVQIYRRHTPKIKQYNHMELGHVRDSWVN
jgi:hypothetical protein